MEILKGRFYNLETDNGTFKLLRTPWKHRIPFWKDHRKRKWRLGFVYMPWHRYYVSHGEGEEFVGGFTVKRALKNMYKRFSMDDIDKEQERIKKFIDGDQPYDVPFNPSPLFL